MISVWEAPLFSVMRKDGAAEVVGLWQLFSDAQSYTDIDADSATGKFAFYRLCLAFLLDIYQPETQDDLADLFEIGCFDMDRVRGYIEETTNEGTCYDLADRDKPFMQAAFSRKYDSKSLKPISNLLFDVPSGNNHIHLDHRLETEHSITIRRAFEALLATDTFCTSGTAGPSNVNNTPPLMAILHGRNLFETLVLNMVSKEALLNIPYGIPAWREQYQVIPKQSFVEMTFLRAMTWQPRRILLEYKEQKVENVYLQAGLNFCGNGVWQDPYVLYRINKDGMIVSIKPILGRELWRDLGTITGQSKGTRGTLPIMNFKDIWINDRPGHLDIEIVGIATNQATILGEVSERLVVPTILLEDKELASAFFDALAATEEYWNKYVCYIRQEFVTDTKYKKNGSIADQAGEVFLHEMNAFLFGEYLSSLVAVNAEHKKVFFDGVFNALELSLRTVVDVSGVDLGSLKKQNTVRNRIMRFHYSKRREYIVES